MPQHHCLTVFIEQLNEKANSCNKFAICKACKIKVNYEYAYENKFANTKLLCKRHLTKCENFKAIHGVKRAQEIIEDTDSELTKQRVQNKKK
jgi:hypothetical protein